MNRMTVREGTVNGLRVGRYWFYVGDGVSGFRRWLYANGWTRRDPGLPTGYSWCVRVDGTGLYARCNNR